MSIEKDVQYLLDKREIEDKAYLYATLIDTRQFGRLEEVFTPDAFIDYTASGGEKGTLPEIVPFLEKSLPMFRSTMHLMGNVLIDIDADGKTAKGSIVLFNPMSITLPDKGDVTIFYGLWYHDEWLKTDAGWRMTKRVQQASYTHNSPW